MLARDVNKMAGWILKHTPMRSNFKEQAELVRRSRESETEWEKNSRELGRLDREIERAKKRLQDLDREEEARDHERLRYLNFVIHALKKLEKSLP